MLENDPLADGTSPEILLDNSDSKVRVTGDWQLVHHDCYGQDALESIGQGTITFLPEIENPGIHTVYLYVARSQNLSPEVNINVRHSEGEENLSIAANKVEIVGQTSGAWINIGAFPMDDNAAIEILSEKNDRVRADAVLLIPQEAKQ